MHANNFLPETIASQVPEIVLTRHELPGTPFAEIAYDSRRIPDPAHTLFVALAGAQRDGHAFIAEAYRKGVRNFLVRDAAGVPRPANVLQAPDTLTALQGIAAWHRSHLPYPIVAITGSNGKTIVKEWLASVLEPAYRLDKSPGSYNSQLGVALSLLDFSTGQDYGLVEAGISRAGEMERLEAMIRPNIGILTHFGDAHAEGFGSESEKLREKLHLFRGCEMVLMSADAPAACAEARRMGLPLQTVGFAGDASLRVMDSEEMEGGVTLRFAGNEEVFLPFQGDAALENGLLVILAARYLGLPWEALRPELRQLHPVSMRTELITDNPELSIINDAYNADRASVRNAFALLASSQSHPQRALILSDLEHLGAAQQRVQEEILAEAEARFGQAGITLIGPVFAKLAKGRKGVSAYPDTSAFLEAFDYDRFRGKTVLLKGARKFALERVIPYLSRRATATWFKINMNHLAHNYRRFRSRLPADVQMVGMVKAFSYGSGTWEIAQALEQEGVDYLAVAYTSEGILLRTHGIRVPIIVMNADTESMEQLFRFDLEPEVYGLDFLRTYIRLGRAFGMGPLRVHVKVDTGMHRLGFPWDQPDPLHAFLTANPDLEVRSVLSHLSSSDEPSLDAYTQEQIRRFDAFYAAMGFEEGERPPRHLLNTAGILRFPAHAYEMVRLGIGLYGVSPFGAAERDLREIGSLHTVITQIHHYPPGTPIGYGCSEATKGEARIATIPVGYADGIRRSLGNGVGKFLVRGQRAPVIGRVCMDMLMLDVTGIPAAAEGDEVVLMGAQGGDFISVEEVAGWCGTIPYEILTGISQRVRRVYVRE